jgi:hypothetical protein
MTSLALLLTFLGQTTITKDLTVELKFDHITHLQGDLAYCEIGIRNIGESPLSLENPMDVSVSMPSIGRGR